jgi:undecaprenyl-diphosphatase
MTASGVWRSRLVWALLGAFVLIAAFYFDADVQRCVAQHQLIGLKIFMTAVSRYGDWPTHVLLGVVGAGIAYACKSRTWVNIFIAMVLACALAGCVNRVIKVTAGRARPSVTVDAGWNGPRLSSKYHAFPSGHTAASTAFFAALFLARPRVGAAFLGIPLLIAFSRVYIGAHYFSDVVFAAMLGAVCAFVVWRILRIRANADAV